MADILGIVHYPGLQNPQCFGERICLPLQLGLRKGEPAMVGT